MTIKKPNQYWLGFSCFSGADRTRTGVQTSWPLAFYMLISLLVVGDEPEKNKPIHHLAE